MAGASRERLVIANSHSFNFRRAPMSPTCSESDLRRRSPLLAYVLPNICVFLPRREDERWFVAAIGQCDIVLDSIGWSGGNSTLESLHHGLPIVTMAAPLMRGRHSMAILKMMGVEETIIETVDDYVFTAVRLAQDVPWRAAVKNRILENKHRVYRDTTSVSALGDFLKSAARRE
jgi:protein O-GlcNAc transferase